MSDVIERLLQRMLLKNGSIITYQNNAKAFSKKFQM